MSIFHFGSDELQDSNKLTYPDNEKEEPQLKMKKRNY